MKLRGLGVALLVAGAVLCAVPRTLAASMPFAGPAVVAERMAVTGTAGELQVYDELALANPQSAALRSLTLPLPGGATQIRLLSGFSGAARVSARHPLAPVRVPPHGHATLIYTYVMRGRLPVAFGHPITMPTARFFVLVRQGQLAVRSADLADVGVQMLNGIHVRAYAAEGLPPGQIVRFTVMAPPGAFARLSALLTPAVWMGVAAALLAALLLLGLRRLPPAEPSATAEAPEP